MFFSILKRDIVRKKAMNAILLVFVILASAFVSSSVNNILTVMSGVDYYFDKAGLSDYVLITMNKSGAGTVGDALNKLDGAQYETEDVIYAACDNFLIDGESPADMKTSAILMSFDSAKLTYFDENNAPLTAVKPGEVYISGSFIANQGLEPGDKLEITHNGVNVSLTIAGRCKDALLGSEFMGNTRFIMNEADYENFSSDELLQTMYSGQIYYIDADDAAAVETAIGENDGVIFNGDRALVKMCYIMSMIVAGVLLIVSVCLILISFVVLRFTISFTLTEEYREIGVMKAIGLRSFRIRSLYMVKYLGIAAVGSAIGFVAGVPFAELLLKSVSENMVLGNDNGVLINVFCSLAVVAVILLFCFTCTGKVKKFSPVDAIRNGQTGERFRKKSLIRLGKSRLGTAGYLALNDILSSPRRYSMVILTFTLCLSLVLVLANTVNTLKGDSLIDAFGIVPSDAYYTNTSEAMSFMTEGGEKLFEQRLDELENELSENGMPARCYTDVQLRLTVSFGGESVKTVCSQGLRTTADEYDYTEGTAPAAANEIAITRQSAEKLGAVIGDTVLIRMNGADEKYIITAYFQSMNNLGEGIRLHESVKTNFAQTCSVGTYQIQFTDSPDEKEVLNRIERLKVLFNTDEVLSTSETVEQITGVSGTVDSIKLLVIAITLIIVVLVTVLMERSFIAKEVSEIALMKAVGIRSGVIIRFCTLRFAIAAAASALLAVVLMYPLTNLAVNPIFAMMGALGGIKYVIEPLEVFVICPLLVIGATVLSALLTSLYTCKITAAETSNIE